MYTICIKIENLNNLTHVKTKKIMQNLLDYFQNIIRSFFRCRYENDLNVMKLTRIDLELTEEINALDYLEKANYFIQKTNKSKIAWKWVILSLHDALYGFVICSLRGCNPDNVLQREKTNEIKTPERLISFYEAIKQSQNKKIVGIKHLTLTDKQKESVYKLNKLFRNNFVHYKPMNWVIEINGMPLIAIDILNIINFFALHEHTVVNLKFSEIEKIKSYISRSIKALQNHKLCKDIKN